MTRLVWGDTGTRLFETGVDRGVLFPPNAAPGVPWSGLTEVNEAPSGGEPQAYYLDGIKYLQVASAEEFNATIHALSAPAEFAACDGTANIYAGLYITQQPRKQFGFSYRTLVGSDVDPDTLGYKIHLVYNSMAKPTSRDNKSLGTTADPLDLSWDISTVPPPITGFKPSAHLVISTLTAVPDHLTALENILYGTDFVDPRLPSVAELIDLFSHGDMTITDNGDGTFSASGNSVDVTTPSTGIFGLNHPAVIDNGDGTFTVATGVDNG